MVIVVVAIIAGVIGWLFAKTTQAPVAPAQKVAAPQVEQQPVTAATAATNTQTQQVGQQTITMTQAKPTISSMNPLDVVKKFYSWYGQYINTASDQSASKINATVKNSGYVTDKFVNQPEGDFDKYVCGQDDEDLIFYYNHQPMINGNTAKVQVTYGWKGNPLNNGELITVSLVQENGTWKIDSCSDGGGVEKVNTK